MTRATEKVLYTPLVSDKTAIEKASRTPSPVCDRAERLQFSKGECACHYVAPRKLHAHVDEPAHFPYAERKKRLLLSRYALR